METTSKRDRSKTTVLAGEWNVSVTDPHSDDYVVLNVFKVDYDQPNQWGGKGVVIDGPNNGLRFPKVATGTSRGSLDACEAAWDFAFEQGLIVYSNYEAGQE